MIKIELLSRENIDNVWELEKKCFPDDPWSYESFEKELDNGISVYIVATDDNTGEVVGYAGVWFMYDCANITNIAVDEGFRREGIGGKLLELLIELSKERNMESITLEVRTSNIPAIQLYEKFGFISCGCRKRYYQGKEDALIMTKQL